MTKAIRIHEHGGPDVLKWEDVPVPAPGPGEVLIKQTAVGLNFVDTYHRTNQMGHKVTFPMILGVQGAGVIEALGPDVAGLTVGEQGVAQRQQRSRGGGARQCRASAQGVDWGAHVPQ